MPDPIGPAITGPTHRRCHRRERSPSEGVRYETRSRLPKNARMRDAQRQ